MQHEQLPTHLTDELLVSVLDQEQVEGCAICGYRLVDTHHILPKQLGGRDEDDNLVDLCPNHHRAMHMLTSYTLDNHKRMRRRYPRSWSRRKRWDFENAVLTDKRLLGIFYLLFVPHWRNAGYPLPDLIRPSVGAALQQGGATVTAIYDEADAA